MLNEYINESSFIVRKSGRELNSFYIDYLGVYKLLDISKLTHLEVSFLKEKYLEHGATYNSELDVYYFHSSEETQKAVYDIMKNLKSDLKGRIIQLTEAEIEYIRQALINEGVNNIGIGTKIKDNIFKKLNF